ncbi:MAG: hypothetical protein ACP5SD_10140 [Elusimicrobiales bacterium]|nr:hypothetical protein [Elusimicrobiales bacterium]HOL63121.1 hypothetical protein [Elusimicrobiales bacterium]HPO95141.1 hypothetical protein [Elusimicrobiales bacterium]
MNTITNILWAVVFSFVGAGIGIYLFIKISQKIPKIFDKITPNIDEDKEMIRGNLAVAEYFGKIVSAGIIGISIIIAAAVIAGIIAGLH